MGFAQINKREITTMFKTNEYYMNKVKEFGTMVEISFIGVFTIIMMIVL